MVKNDFFYVYCDYTSKGDHYRYLYVVLRTPRLFYYNFQLLFNTATI